MPSLALPPEVATATLLELAEVESSPFQSAVLAAVLPPTASKKGRSTVSQLLDTEVGLNCPSCLLQPVVGTARMPAQKRTSMAAAYEWLGSSRARHPMQQPRTGYMRDDARRLA
jgi:hypothetical protein